MPADKKCSFISCNRFVLAAVLLSKETKKRKAFENVIIAYNINLKCNTYILFQLRIYIMCSTNSWRSLFYLFIYVIGRHGCLIE